MEWDGALKELKRPSPGSWTNFATMTVMNAKVRELYAAAAELPDGDRAELARMLLETRAEGAETEVEVAWAEEVERRIRQVDEGEVDLVPWEQVRAELFALTRNDR
jgi:putative addiction module component (TIGR02574 family)